MNLSAATRRSWLTVCLSLIVTTTVFAQTTQPYEPKVGQKGKDVIWVPTRNDLVEKMLDMAKVTSEDFVIDLGSGDGRTVIAAARRGARALGVEFNGDLVELSRRTAVSEGVADRATFVQDDLFKTDLSEATVITLFLLTDINLALRPTLLGLKPGTRVVSNTFTMAEWVPDETTSVQGSCETWCNAYFWWVPAKVAGSWQVPEGEMVLEQKFQMVSGRLGPHTIENGRMRGDELSFTAGGSSYTGRVNGKTIEGTSLSDGRSTTWSATRIGGFVG